MNEKTLKEQEKKNRLAEQLRSNLKKRKQQSRERENHISGNQEINKKTSRDQ